MATTIQERIQLVTPEHARISQQISEADHTISEYEQNVLEYETLDDQIFNETVTLHKYISQVKIYHEEYKTYQASLFKHLMYKLGGMEKRYWARAEKMHKKVVVARLAQTESMNRLDVLHVKLYEARNARTEYLAAISARERAIKELDTLYETVFSGISTGLPDEEAQENELQEAQRRLESIQQIQKTEQQVRDALNVADIFLIRAIFGLLDIMNGVCPSSRNGGLLDEVVDNHTLRCREHVSQAEMMISRACEMQLPPKTITSPQIPPMDFLASVHFDNFMHQPVREKMYNVVVKLCYASSVLKRDVRDQDRRLLAVKGDVREAGDVVEGRRVELKRVRGLAFRRMVGEVGDGGVGCRESDNEEVEVLVV